MTKTLPAAPAKTSKTVAAKTPAPSKAPVAPVKKKYGATRAHVLASKTSIDAAVPDTY